MTTSGIQTTPVCCYGSEYTSEHHQPVDGSPDRRSNDSDGNASPRCHSQRLKKRRDAVDHGRETPIPLDILESLMKKQNQDKHQAVTTRRSRAPPETPIGKPR